MMLRQSEKAGDRTQGKSSARNTYGYFVIHFSLVVYGTTEA